MLSVDSSTKVAFCCSLVPTLAFVSAISAGIGAASGSMGAAILAQQYQGYANISAAAAAGAVGGSLLGPVISLFSPTDKSDKEESNLQLLLIATITSALYGLVGQAILNSAGHDTIGLGRQAAASAVGGSCLLAGFLVLGFCVLCCGIANGANSDRDTHRQLLT